MSRSEAEILEEMLRWIKFRGMQEAKDIVDDTLSFPNDAEKQRDTRIAYELTNGENSQRDIAARTSVSYSTIGNWQGNWEKLGIVDKNSEGSYEHLISLDDLGLECPSIPEPEEN